MDNQPNEHSINNPQAVDTNKESKVKKPSTPMTIEKKLRILAGAGFGIIIFFQIYTMAQISSIADRQALMMQSIQKEFKALQASTAQLGQDKDALNAQFKQLSEVVVNESSKSQADIQTLGQQFNGLKQQLNDINKTATQNRDSLTKMQKTLDDIQAKGLSTASNPAAISTVNSASDAKVSNEYRIFKVASYGTIIQNTQGIYTIATIGKTLPNVGMITEITQDRVVAGNTQIIANPTGFKLDESAAAQAYRIGN